MIELALPAKRKFNFGPIGKNAENNVWQVEVFQEHRLTQQSDKRLAPGDEVLVSLIGGDQAKIKVGVCISRAPGIGAEEEAATTRASAWQAATKRSMTTW